jgi:hypothetical protein
MDQLPKPPSPEITPAGFVLIPFGSLGPANLEQWQFQRWLYMKALEQAQEVVRPSLPERDLLGVWN